MPDQAAEIDRLQDELMYQGAMITILIKTLQETGALPPGAMAQAMRRASRQGKRAKERCRALNPRQLDELLWMADILEAGPRKSGRGELSS